MCFYGVLGRQHSHDKNMSYDRPAPKTLAVPSVHTHSCGQLWLSRLRIRAQHRTVALASDIPNSGGSFVTSLR